MIIPNGPAGTDAEAFPTLRTQHVRTYGAGGFVLGDMERMRGCPSWYRAKYVERRVETDEHRDALTYGTLIHNVLYRMEEDGVGPDEALERSWPAGLSIEHWQEARNDLETYLAKGGPMARYGTVAVEVELVAPLYEDEDFGQIWFGGRLDWLGIDVNEPTVLHMVDYKTNRWPPSLADVRGDVQLKSYDWLVRQNWSRMMGPGTPQVVVHLDAIKFHDVEHRFDRADLDEWQAWVTAIARTILRDESGDPELNPGCSWCPIKWTCPQFVSLPGAGSTLLERMGAESLDERKRWRDEAYEMKSQLEAGIAEVDAAIKEKAWHDGEVVLGDHIYFVDDAWATRCDVARLQEVLGDARFYELVGTPSRTAFDQLAARLDPVTVVDARACWSRELVGQKVKKKKVEESE